MTNHQLINSTSLNVEYYSPQPIVESARFVMGGITLDPASCEQANKFIKAVCYYTKEIDGLTQEWFGNIFLNHPFGRVANPLWINKLLSEMASGHMRQACCITYACTSEAWFTPLMSFPQCFLVPRTNYRKPDGTIYRGVTKGSVVTYIGHKNREFEKEFSKHGVVKF